MNKSNLDVQQKRKDVIKNSEIEDFISLYSTSEILVILEISGSYEKDLIIKQHVNKVSDVNPYYVQIFIRSSRDSTKTDGIDAKILSESRDNPAKSREQSCV